MQPRSVAFRLVLLFALPALVSAETQAQTLEDLRSRFQRETDPVSKAKAFPKMGDVQLNEVRQLASQDKFEEALAMLDRYRDDAQLAYDALKSSRINAEKKSGGFKQLQIHLRRGARNIEDTVAALPFEQRQPFAEIQKDVERLDQLLIEMLFPRQPGRKDDSKPKKQG